jgi:hypothetical protein
MSSNTYTDRGIIKWAPFAALVGFESIIKELVESKDKITKPELSDDQLESLNITLSEIKLNSTEVKVTYYKAGYFIKVFGIVKKIDYNNKTIKMDEIIKVDDIFEITII